MEAYMKYIDKLHETLGSGAKEIVWHGDPDEDTSDIEEIMDHVIQRGGVHYRSRKPQHAVLSASEYKYLRDLLDEHGLTEKYERNFIEYDV